MATFAKTITPGIACKTPGNEHKIGPIQAGTGEAIASGDACRITSTGTVVRSIATSAANAVVHGFAGRGYPNVGEPITLHDNVPFAYGPATATPGAPLFLSASVAGGLDTATSTYAPTACGYVREVTTDEGTNHAICQLFRALA